MTVFLIVALAALSIFLAWRLVSAHRGWQPERDRLQAENESLRRTINLAKLLVARDGLSRDRSWRMWAGPPEHQRYLAEVLEHEDTLQAVDPENTDPSPPPDS